MGRLLRREHEGKRPAFAALLTTGMIAALLAFAALAAPSPAYAAELQGSGTADDPVLIYSTDDLIAWCNKLNEMGKDQERQQHARLMNHLVSPGPDGTEHGGAVTDDIIRQMNHPDLQVAEFNGNGRLIELQLTTNDYGALFATGGQPGDAGTTKVKDLHFIGSVQHARVNSEQYAGALFERIGKEGDPSQDRKVTIVDCTNQASVLGDQSTGGLIGSFVENRNGTGNITIERCSNFGEITSANGHAGGLAGSVVKVRDRVGTTHLQYCTNDGAVKSTGGWFESRFGHGGFGSSTGGLVGYLACDSSGGFSLDNDYNRGSIYNFAGGYSGGLVGYMDFPKMYSPVGSCYNTGSLQPQRGTAEYIGGLIGHAAPFTTVEGSVTMRESVPSDSVSDSTRNGTLIAELYFYRDAHEYLDDDFDGLMLPGVGEARNIKAKLIDPTTGFTTYESAYWNTCLSLPSPDSEIEGYRFAYWTIDAPDVGGTYNEPPREFKSSDFNDPGQRVYGGDITLYAYYEPSVVTVKFDLNKPAEGSYTCSLDPKGATKTLAEGEPVGALPTAACVNPNDKNDTRAFLGWATEKDGNDPKAEWVSESSDNLYNSRDAETNIVMLYAQWADTSVGFEITYQPKDWQVSALAEYPTHDVCFDFCTTYEDYSATLQYRKNSSSGYEDLDVPHAAMPNQFHFDLESADEAAGDYRIKIEYYDSLSQLGTLYTSSAKIVMDIPQSEAKVTLIELSDPKPSVAEDNLEKDEILGTASYDVDFRISDDSLPKLVGDESDEIRHRAWIEGGSSNTYPGSDVRLHNKVSGTLENQHLVEGQTYTLCVSRWVPHSDYLGESEPYRVPFVVPYTESIPAKVGGVLVTQDPVVENGHPSGSVHNDYSIGIHETFNLGVNVEYQYAQPEGRQVHVQWQYGLGGTWVDMPDELFVKDEQGNPICGFAWEGTYREKGRAYATLKAEAKLDNKAFRVKLSTPSAPVDTISDSSWDELSVLVPTPKDMQVKVNDTDVSVSWTWKDAVGNTTPTDGYYVSIEHFDPRWSGEERWVKVNRGRVYEGSYQAALDPQQNYRVSVRADTDGLQSPSVEKEFSTLGEPGVAWENLYPYCTAYLPSKHQNDEISVDFDWAGYNDGKHTVRYSWYLNGDKDAKRGYEHFVTTESDSVNFPEDFEGGNEWDPTEAWWVKVEAQVWTLTDEGELGYPVSKVQSSALPVWHETSDSQNLTVEDIGSHSMTVCWDAPAEGLVREYKIKASDGRSWIVSAEAEKNKDGHYEATIDGLDSDTEYYVTVYTVDSFLQCTNLPGSTRWDCTTLPSPEVGTWTVTADPSNVKQGEEVTLSASYAANSGKFPTAAELQWYSWREGEADWQPEGDPITLDHAGNDGSKDYTTTLKHTVTSKDYGRQWKLGVKAASPDELVTDSSNVVAVAITPPTPTNVACDAPTPTSLPVSWMPVESAEGYQIKCVKPGVDGNPVSATTYTVAASSLTQDAGGKLCYEVMNLEPNTTYQMSVAAFVHGVIGEFSAVLEPRTLAEPTIETPVFQQVPKTAWVEANEDATFTAQAKVNDGGTITYAWQRKGAGEQDFAPIAKSDKYVMSENAGVATLTVNDVAADDVAAAFRCVATNSKDNQTANAASAAAYLTVAPVAPTDVQAQATSATTGEVTWEASGAIHRFAVTWQQVDENGSTKGSEYSKVVTIPNDKMQGSCQLEGLLPGTSYRVAVYAAPEAGFRSEKVTASLATPAASALDSATVSPDKTLVKPGETVTFKVETNVDGLLPEQLKYRWQRNAFGESWIDVEGEAGAKKTLSVTAPEGGSVDGYRYIVTSTRTTTGVGDDTKSVTSSVGLLLTSVPVAPPVQLAAEPGTTSVHLTWASDDPRDVTYQVQYAEGPTPNDDAWQTVDNVGSSTSCDVEGLKANTVYSWRVQAVVRDQLWSEWAQADTFITLEEPSALATVSVTPRWGAAVAGSSKGVTYTAVTNIDNALNGETLSYQWQESATGVEWSDVQGATEATYVADTANAKPRSCQYRCVVTASKDGAPLKTITSESVDFRTTAMPPTDLVAESITAATADLSWEGSLVEGLSYRVFWRASGADAWTSTSDLTEATYTLKSLMPATTYEWYVQVMDNGEPSARSVTSLFVTQSLSPIPQLTRVVVGPVDQTPSAIEQATFTAYTNVDDMTDATMTYKWEMRDLDSDSSNPSAWTTLRDKTTREIELDPGMDGYVRCTVTYTPPTSAFVQPLDNTPVPSTNEARVRVMPAAPSNLTVNAVGKTIADISWTGGAGGPAFDLVYRVVGSSEWTSVPGLDSASTNLVDLKPGAVYEWNVRSVAYGASGDPLRSDWVAGPLFTTKPEDIVFSRAEVTPSATSIMAGADSTVTLTANTDADAGNESLTYQWQRLVGDTWQKMDGKTSNTLQVSAKGLSVGEHAYRCEVTATRGGQEKTVESSESVVTVMPAAPTDLSVGEFVLVDPAIPTGSVKTAFHWKWGGTGALPDGATFEVSYRKLAGPGAILDGWVSEGLTVDNENRTCEAVLESKDITYQWRVRVMQNGATSSWSETNTFTTKLEEHTDISYVEVAPSDSLVSNDAAATVTLTASTNVDSDPTLKYEWQWCPLTTKDPRKDGAKWETIEGESTGTITLSGDNRNRYVRCKVTQTVDGTAKTKASNPACVRTEPLPPHDLSANAADEGGIRLSWQCNDERARNDAQKNVIGYEVNYRKIGTSEWAEEISSSKYDCKLDAQMLESDATYEWRVRTILSGDVGELTKGGPHTEWVDGPVFAAPKVAVTPTRAAAVIGNGRTLTFTAMPNAVITDDSRGKTYQWQRNDGSGWKNMLGEESVTLNIVADNAVTAGTSRYRCVVTMGGYTTTSNEVTCTLAPAAPANLTASGVTSSEAKLAWDWAQRGLPNAAEFKVLYRESGAKIWETATAAGSAREFVLKDLKPETIYEWRVRAVQNGVESLPSFANLFVTASEHPALKLESVLVDPSDQAVAPEAEATVKATTNLDGMVDPGELTYVWEKRALDSNPSASDAWQTIEDEKGSSVTSSVITSGFVRCKVAYTPAGSAAAETVVSNEASVRVQPVGAPTGLEVKDIGDTAATFAWGGAVPTNGSFTLLYRTAGTEAWTTVPKLTASPYVAQNLAPGTTYEWRMCSVSADGLTSEWVDGSRFTTTAQDAVLGEVKVAPERAEAVAGDSALVEDFFATVTGTAEGQSLAYQWQVLLSGGWTNLPGETGERTHLSVANLEPGEYSLRCVVTATAPGGKSKTVESNKATLALSLATPSDLSVQRVTRGAAMLTWTWAGPGAVDSFNVRYREEGASDTAWVNVPADSIDPASTTCIIKGLAPSTSYEWQVQAVQGDQTSAWVASGFVTLSDGPLKVARIWPSDVTVAKDEQARFVVFTNRGDAEDVSYEWQRRGLYSEDVEGSWETIPNATGRVLTLDANTAGYVRCVATQAAPAAQATEVVETPEAVEAPQAVASNETIGANEAPDANETNEASEANETNETNEASETTETPVTPVASEVAETSATPTPPSVAISNQARVRVEPSVPSGLAVGAAGLTNAALSWAAADVDGVVFTLAYRVAGSPDWTEVPGLTAPAYELGGLVQGTSYEWRVQAVVGTGDDALKSAWACGDSFTTQTMRTYHVTAGADGTWKPGQPGLAFTIDAPRDKFLSLAVDGAELVQGTDYTVVEGSTVLTLSSDYLASLRAGKHELVATFSDGAASTTFTVAAAEPPTPSEPSEPETPGASGDQSTSPAPLPSGGKALAPTGDPLSAALPLVGMLAVASACVAIAAFARKRWHVLKRDRRF